MANLTKLDFVALDVTGKNYLSWILDAEMHLAAMGLGDTIVQNNVTTAQDRAKAMIFLRHHLHEDLKNEYLTVKNPLILWGNLKDRFDHQKMVVLPKARYDWLHLRLQDFKSVSNYNSAMFKIVSQLKLCGVDITDDDMLEKTFSTFHATNIILQQQYREKGFKKYSELISCLLVAEQNNELLMKNHETRPTGSTPFPEVNAIRKHDPRRDHGRGRGRGRFRGRGRTYNHGQTRDKFGPYTRNSGAKNDDHPKWTKNNEKRNIVPKKYEDKCYRCGMKGHWSRVCHTAKHLVDLYQASIDKKGKNVEVNFTSQNSTYGRNNDDDDDDLENIDVAHLDVADFFEHPEGKIDHLIGDGSVQKN